MKISLIITTYNSVEPLNATLETAMAQVRQPDEIIIADDGSAQPTRDLIDSFKARSPTPIIHTWQEDDGSRAARARNMAIAAATTDYLVFTDGDILMDPHFVADHERHAEPGCFVQGGRILLEDEETKEILKQDDKLAGFTPLFRGIGCYHKVNRSNFLSRLTARFDDKSKGTRTCNFSVWRDDAIRVNGFNEEFIGWAREDTEFAQRLLFAGLRRKKDIFNAICFHLYHPLQSRDTLHERDKLLRQSMESGRMRCEIGVDAHLTGSS